MKISVVQHDVLPGSPGGTLQTVERLLLAASQADVYVFPEMFATGFVTDARIVAESAGGETFCRMRELAARLDAAVAGSVAVADGGCYYNRFYFVMPDGHFYSYDKRHLFSYGGEQTNYTPGKERTVAEYKGVRFLLQVCYDLRFPVWSRNVGDYDVALYAASWPDSRIAVWDTLLQARAIENQCYVVGVNRVGGDGAGRYSGHSAVFDCYGRKIAACAPGEVCVETAEVDLAKLSAFREKFPVLADADRFKII